MVLAVSLHAWLYVLFSIILVTLTTRWLNMIIGDIFPSVTTTKVNPSALEVIKTFKNQHELFSHELAIKLIR